MQHGRWNFSWMHSHSLHPESRRRFGAPAVEQRRAIKSREHTWKQVRKSITTTTFTCNCRWAQHYTLSNFNASVTCCRNSCTFPLKAFIASFWWQVASDINKHELSEHSIIEGARESAYMISQPSAFFTDAPFRKNFNGPCPDCPWEHASQIWRPYSFNRFKLVWLTAPLRTDRQTDRRTEPHIHFVHLAELTKSTLSGMQYLRRLRRGSSDTHTHTAWQRDAERHNTFAR